MIRYRLYVGSGDTMAVARSVAKYFSGATVFPAMGLWEGMVEESTVVELISRSRDVYAVRRLADELRQAFGQSEVMVTVERLDTQKIRSRVPAAART